MKVLIVAPTRNRRTAVLDDARFLLEQGAQVELITLDRADWPELGGPALQGVVVHELGPSEDRHPLPRCERVLVFVLPSAVLHRLQAALRRLASLPVVGRAVSPMAHLAERVEPFWDRVARAGHNRGFQRLYRMVRPWVLWRSARAGVLPRLDVASLDRVVVSDVLGIPTGWHLARENPGLDVSLRLDRSTVRGSEVGRAVP